ncbi:MAG: hypothetical protein K0U47_06025 [Epsilonproteobacteria bacterium]|nr:hypothetical protein [Campylobacterota bacterium]
MKKSKLSSALKVFIGAVFLSSSLIAMSADHEATAPAAENNTTKSMKKCGSGKCGTGTKVESKKCGSSKCGAGKCGNGK